MPTLEMHFVMMRAMHKVADEANCNPICGVCGWQICTSQQIFPLIDLIQALSAGFWRPISRDWLASIGHEVCNLVMHAQILLAHQAIGNGCGNFVIGQALIT